jgi:RHS repeat-associated protein
MKTKMNAPALVLALLALLGTPHTTSAYYDPGVQRWINRDPLATQIPQNNRIWGDHLKIEAAEVPDLYTYVANDPIRSTDAFGLFVPRPKPITTSTICLSTTLIGIGVGVCLDVICEIHRQNERADCFQQCHENADAGEDNCRSKPTREERRRCWEKLYEDLANCIRDCNRKYSE